MISVYRRTSEGKLQKEQRTAGKPKRGELLSITGGRPRTYKPRPVMLAGRALKTILTCIKGKAS